MTVFIFAGPSLPREDRLRFPEFEFLPPARQGDLFAAASRNATAIGLVDGYFDGQPAVWHKEVLWALSRGIAVFGAASMGALRAAELEAYGMTGIGRIFRDYRDGVLRDDDEVALLHGPAETDHLPLTEPMVNIRATVSAATAGGVLDERTAQAITDSAKAQYYRERSWDTVVAAAGLSPDAELAFRYWLPTGRKDQKREDALALLDAMRDHARTAPAAAPCSFHFERTEAWENAEWRSAAIVSGDDAEILNELRLDRESYLRVRSAALAHLAVVRDHFYAGENVDRVTRDFRLARGLARGSDLAHWCKANGVDSAGFDRLMKSLAAQDEVESVRDAELHRLMLDRLRIDGAYPSLRARARAKKVMAAGMSNTPPSPVLIAWFFEARLQEPYPEDLQEYARNLGFVAIEDFYRVVAREYAFLTENGAATKLE